MSCLVLQSRSAVHVELCPQLSGHTHSTDQITVLPCPLYGPCLEPFIATRPTDHDLQCVGQDVKLFIATRPTDHDLQCVGRDVKLFIATRPTDHDLQCVGRDVKLTYYTIHTLHMYM